MTLSQNASERLAEALRPAEVPPREKRDGVPPDRRRGRWPGIVPAALLGLVLALPVPVRAAEPMNQVKEAVERSIGILDRADLKPEGRKEERRDLLRREIRPLFDFGEMAKRSLGARWRTLTERDRDRFVQAFSAVIESSYLGKIEGLAGGRSEYLKERVEPPYAEVKTLLVTDEGEEIAADYRLLKKGDRWQIYDVVVEGVSVVSNCRSQFGGLLKVYSVDRLIETLRSRADRRG